jgi:hypothetical protein
MLLAAVGKAAEGAAVDADYRSGKTHAPIRLRADVAGARGRARSPCRCGWSLGRARSLCRCGKPLPSASIPSLKPRCHICTGTGPTLPTSASRLGPPNPDLRRDRARPAHICTGTGQAQCISAPRLRLPCPHLPRDWAHPCHICTGTGLALAAKITQLESIERKAELLKGTTAFRFVSTLS